MVETHTYTATLCTMQPSKSLDISPAVSYLYYRIDLSSSDSFHIKVVPVQWKNGFIKKKKKSRKISLKFEKNFRKNHRKGKNEETETIENWKDKKQKLSKIRKNLRNGPIKIDQCFL